MCTLHSGIYRQRATRYKALSPGNWRKWAFFGTLQTERRVNSETIPMAMSHDPQGEMSDRTIHGGLALGVALAALVAIAGGTLYPESPVSGLATLAALVFAGAYLLVRWRARRRPPGGAESASR
jgi:hypothetical protein